jgi:hypothetical protein
MSKGSRQRPVDKAKFDAAWGRIFSQKSVKSTNNQPTGANDNANVQRQEEERREVKC